MVPSEFCWNQRIGYILYICYGVYSAVSYQYGEHVAWRLALHIDAVDLDDLVADVYQARSIGSAAVHDASNDDLARLLIRLDGCTLESGKGTIRYVFLVCVREKEIEWLCLCVWVNVCMCVCGGNNKMSFIQFDFVVVVGICCVLG